MGLTRGYTLLYASALEAHLRRSGEQGLHQAYELGRQAMAEGVGVLDLTLLHHETLSRLLDAADVHETAPFGLAAQFMAEVLSPFEMMLRGYQEANDRLSTANRDLTRVHDALARAHQQLRAEVEDREKAEEQLFHAKKLQAVGLLAGGVAHHFNNLLTVVLGNLELARRQLKGDRRVEHFLLAARHGAERGAEVTRQLLSFSRQQMLQPRVLDVAAWLAEIEPLLVAALRGDITVETEVAGDLLTIEVDPGQLELALLNLAVNARDAMPNGGTLLVTARNARLADSRLGLEGDYVAIEVADTGEGLPPEVLPQVFEPFFTTKNKGPGAGLGLSQVHGFVHQSGGAVEMENRVGGGAVVRIYLPARESRRASPAAARPRMAPAPQAAGRVLVVEDEASLARLASDLLESFGYDVTVARRAQTALDVIGAGDPIDVVFSDVVMPGGMDGVQLAAELAVRRPDLPVLLTSGYHEAVAELDARGLAFIPKPYRPEDLRAGIDKLLSERPRLRP
jgi:signal transduction histidine kinase